MADPGSYSAQAEVAILACGPVVLAVISACALARFADRSVNCVSFLTCVLGLTFSCSIVAVVPYDVRQALLDSEDPAPHEEGRPSLLRSSWAAIYWMTAVLCYLLIPVMMEYEASGEFTMTARLRASLRKNVIFYAVYIVVALLLLIWLIVSGEVQGSLQSWCIAASNAWGLLLLTVLMGFGLVGVPRHLWRLSLPGDQLRRIYVTAVPRDEARLSRLFELQDSMTKVRAELNALDLEDAEVPLPDRRTIQVAYAQIQHTLEACVLLHGELASHGSNLETASLQATRRQDSDSEGPVRTRRSSREVNLDPAKRIARLAKLHGSLKAAALEARRAAFRWDSHVERCLFFEDLEERRFKTAAELITARPRSGGNNMLRIWFCWNNLLALWLHRLRPRFLRCLSCACAVLSGVIVLGQLTMFNQVHHLSLLSLLFYRDSGPVLTEVLCMVPLGYMTYTAYFSIFRFRIPGWYGLYAGRNTDAGSLLFCASAVARLAAPLCYHFLLLIRVRGTTFQAFMGQMNVVPVLGESFNEVFPCIIAVLCCFNLLNVYSHIVNLLSLGTIEFDATGGNGDDPHSEGKQLIERERRRRAEETTSLELQSCGDPGRLAEPLASPGR